MGRRSEGHDLSLEARPPRGRPQGEVISRARIYVGRMGKHGGRAPAPREAQLGDQGEGHALRDQLFPGLQPSYAGQERPVYPHRVGSSVGRLAPAPGYLPSPLAQWLHGPGWPRDAKHCGVVQGSGTLGPSMGNQRGGDSDAQVWGEDSCAAAQWPTKEAPRGLGASELLTRSLQFETLRNSDEPAPGQGTRPTICDCPL